MIDPIAPAISGGGSPASGSRAALMKVTGFRGMASLLGLSVQRLDSLALPGQHCQARQRGEEGDEEEARPGEAEVFGIGGVPRGRPYIDAAERGERGKERVLRRGEAV